MVSINKAKLILDCRKKSKINDNIKLQKIRENFLDFLSGINCCIGSIKKEKIEYMDTRYGIKTGLRFDEKIIYNGGIKVSEIYNTKNGTLNSKPKSYQFFNPKYNTRTKINSETCFEVDKLPYEKAFSVVCEVILSLMRKEYHFAVFYAQGQRSPHVRIFDFEELIELNPKQRIKAQVLFWKQHTPFGCFQYVDTGMFIDGHNLQLEFAPHWKYHTPFNLLFEYFPDIEKCKN